MANDGERALATEEVRNLVVQYAYAVDSGDFAAVGDFYDGVTTRVFDADGAPTGDEHTRTTAEVQRFYEEIITVDAAGRPNTQHLISNVQVDVAADCQSATARSTFTVLNQAAGGAIEVIITGSYVDRFERLDHSWRLRERDEHMGLVGDLGHHLKIDLGLAD
jgi:3-phenylpropionate/cinnamic acid dioxygenase small subunit